MSWSMFVDMYLVNFTHQPTGRSASNVCEQGAIFGLDGAVWAATPGFSLDSYSTEIMNDDGSSSVAPIDEFATLEDAFQNNGLTSRAGGLRLHRERYHLISFDGEKGVMYLRKRGGGACVARTTSAFVIGTFSSQLQMTGLDGSLEPQNPGATNRSCEDLQAVLLQSGL